MTDAETKELKLTPKRLFCLQQLSRFPVCSFSISKDAIGAGLNKTRCKFEWADAPLRDLRAAGLVEKTGRMSAYYRAVHAITPLGIAALRDAEND